MVSSRKNAKYANYGPGKSIRPRSNNGYGEQVLRAAPSNPEAQYKRRAEIKIVEYLNEGKSLLELEKEIGLTMNQLIFSFHVLVPNGMLGRLYDAAKKEGLIK